MRVTHGANMQNQKELLDRCESLRTQPASALRPSIRRTKSGAPAIGIPAAPKMSTATINQPIGWPAAPASPGLAIGQFRIAGVDIPI